MLVPYKKLCAIMIVRCEVCKKMVDRRATVKVEKDGKKVVVCRHHFKEN